MIQSNQINYSGQVDEDGTLKLVVNNSQAENFTSSAITNVSDNHLNIRPSPQADASLSNVYVCEFKIVASTRNHRFLLVPSQ